MSLNSQDNSANIEVHEPLVRRSVSGVEPTVFTEIYEPDTNMIIWQRLLEDSVKNDTVKFLDAHPNFKIAMTLSPETALPSLIDALGSTEYEALAENISELVDMFCCLFDLSKAGLRLTALEKAMCPKFHVDVVPCRLVTTFQGVATEWLEHAVVDRSKLGSGSLGLKDSESGIFQSAQDIQRLQCGDVALLKGENWFDNENAGLVHRSPSVQDDEMRLLLTLDFAD